MTRLFRAPFQTCFFQVDHAEVHSAGEMPVLEAVPNGDDRPKAGEPPAGAELRNAPHHSALFFERGRLPVPELLPGTGQQPQATPGEFVSDHPIGLGGVSDQTGSEPLLFRNVASALR